jgi:hypothetical protein
MPTEYKLKDQLSGVMPGAQIPIAIHLKRKTMRS